jgi:hypothetical membrane protein
MAHKSVCGGTHVNHSLKETWIKVTGVFGIMTPIIAFGCILSAISSATDFSWTDNALSDLGVMPEPTSTIFNIGLIISGILAGLFASGIYFDFGKNMLGRSGTIVFLFSAAALTAIGIFPESMKPTHFYASVAFFALFPISLILLTAAYFRSAKRAKGWFTLTVALFAALIWMLEFSFRYVPGVAIPEALSAVAVSLWTVITSFQLAKKHPQSVAQQ